MILHNVDCFEKLARFLANNNIGKALSLIDSHLKEHTELKELFHRYIIQSAFYKRNQSLYIEKGIISIEDYHTASAQIIANLLSLGEAVCEYVENKRGYLLQLKKNESQIKKQIEEHDYFTLMIYEKNQIFIRKLLQGYKKLSISLRKEHEEISHSWKKYSEAGEKLYEEQKQQLVTLEESIYEMIKFLEIKNKKDVNKLLDKLKIEYQYRLRQNEIRKKEKPSQIFEHKLENIGQKLKKLLLDLQ